MRHNIKRIIRWTQILVIVTVAFTFFGLVDAVLFFAGELSITSAIEYLEIIAGAEGLSISAYLYKKMRDGMWDEILNCLLGLVDGTWDNDKDDEKRVIELEKEKEKMKQLRLR